MDRKLIGSAGEHLVCGVLAQFDWAPALTREGIARTDLLAVNATTSLTVSVQVKTATCGTGRRVNWPLGIKGIVPAQSLGEWYLLVKLEGPTPAHAHYFVVPRDHVAAATWISHMNWLTAPSAPAGSRNAPIAHARVDEGVFSPYAERWDLLNRSTEEVPVMLPPEYRDLANGKRVGLPPGHPWHNVLPNW
jgi:hypothetical protein